MQPTVIRRMIASSLLSAGVMIVTATGAAADPGAAPVPVPPAPGADTDVVAAAPPAVDPAAPVVAAPADEPVAADTDSPSSVACKQFSAALSYAATNYEDFAYATAGGGNYVDYSNPEVQNSNVVGRTALREAASTAWGASTTPGLSGDISAPMQSWSLRATKLLLVMGVHGGGDSLNNTADGMNTDAHNAQMACALAGTPA